MKHLLLSLFLLPFIVAGQAQQSSDAGTYYYFGNTKISLRQSNEKIYMRLPVTEVAAVKASLRNNYQLAEKSFTAMQADNYIVIDLTKSNASSQLKVIVNSINASGKASLVRPALIANDGKDVVIDEGFYVKLKPGTSYGQLVNFAAQNNCLVEKAYAYNNKTYLLKAGAANKYDGLKMANLFFESGLFEYAEPDFRLLDALFSTPNDPLFNLQWSALNTGAANQGSGTLGADIDLDEAWDITTGNAAIKIAVLDEGIQRTHPDLINNISPLGFGLVAGNAATGDILATTRSHGTSCAGIIAAEANNNIGIAGIAPLSKLIPVNITVNTTGTFGTSAQIAQSLDWAWNEGGADILSNSWGGGTASSLIQDAIRRATTLGRAGKGSIVVFSSGNNDAGVSNPAIFPETIAVGAMSMCNQRKSPSTCDGESFWGGNYGTGLDISAPGVRIATTLNTGTGTAPNADYNLAFNGTSSAAPMVVGVAALVLSVNNNFTQVQVREILERSTKKTGGYSYAAAIGQPNGSWSSELGHGMVNAKNAVLAAQNPSFCRVDVSSTGALQVCSFGAVPLQVTNNVSGNNYAWRRDGNIVGTGTSINANVTGSYDVVLTTGTGCKDTSYAFPVIVSAAQGTLTADAGRDTSLCPGAKLFIGGGPAGFGGTGMIHPMRALAADISNNLFLRFDPSQPSLNYKTIKSTFITAPATGEFYPGSAATPYGLYMINKLTKILLKIDTANGTTYPIGLTTTSSISFNGMTYDPSTGKIFAIGSSGTVNQLYEINRITGAATFTNSISGVAASNLIISLSADNAGQLYGLRLSTVINVSSQLMAINKTTGAAVAVGNTGFLANFAQSGDADPLTDELYQTASTSVLGSGASFSGKGLWKLNKTTGLATLIGSVAQPFNSLDALAFANKEYKYQWSPATNLGNANDANPQFTATAPGTFIYTLTITDLCGNTATDQVTIVVNAPPTSPVINTAPVLSHRNAFAGTLSYTQQAGLNYSWVQDGTVQLNTTNSFPVSFNNSSSQFTVRTTNPVTGCVSNSAPVSIVYSAGVLLNNNDALTVCDSSFYDFGGPTGSTGNNFSRTFTPETPGTKLKLSFYNLQLANFATLFIYDGPDANAPRIEALSSTFNGNTLREYTASNPDGVLTVRFAIGSSQSSGWLAGITCETGLQFRTISNGNWIATGIWQTKLPAAPETAWAAATRLPNKGDDLITVRHDLGLNQPLQIDDVIITSTGKVNVNGSGYFNLYKVKPATELMVQTGGTLQLASSSFMFGSGKIELQGNLQNEGAITVDELLVNGTTAQQLLNTTATASSITKLTMSNSAGLTLQGFHRVGTLNLNNGLINTSANNTFILENSSTGNAGSYVNGVVRFDIASGDNVNIPIGKNGAYRPLILTANSANGEGSALMQAEVLTGAPTTRTFPAGITNVSAIRYYRVSVLENGSNVRDFGITLPYGLDDAVADHTILKIAKDNGAGAWIDLGGSASGAAPGTITSNEFSSFSDFVLANVLGGPLPVTLVSFSGRLQNAKAFLNWTAENEINFARYQIERSSNGANFSVVGSVDAQRSTQTVSYSFTDDQLPAGIIIYYRLKMIDIDGQFRYSNVIQLRKEAIVLSRIVALAPNPFHSKLTMLYESSKKEQIAAAVFNSQGQLIKQLSFTVTEGVNQLYVDGSDLPAGIYLLQLKTIDQVITQKIIKQ